MNSDMYDIPTILIALFLLVSMSVCIEVGYRFGRRRQASSAEAHKTHLLAIQASLLGILALLLGFTFSLSLSRYESRSKAVVEEANALGTAWLRTELLPQSARAEIRQALREYVDQRVEASEVSLARHEQRAATLEASNRLGTALWSLSARVAQADPNPVTVGLYLQSLNEALDNAGRREAELDRHVPQLVLILLYATFLLAGGVIGITAGLNGHRASLVTYALVTLIVLLVFIIVDLDRPRRGLIRVSHQPLVDVRHSMGN